MASKQSFWWVFLAISVPTLLAAGCLGESLWLDELHTSWCISGNWNEVPERALAGNQPPLFMFLVRATRAVLAGLLGQPQDWFLRIPSLLAHLLNCGLIFILVREAFFGARRFPADGNPGTHPKTRSSLAMGLAACLLTITWIGLDRTQLFYATEARSYALLQSLSLAGWMLIAAIVHRSKQQHLGIPQAWPWLAWALVAILALHLHLIAVLSIAWQSLVLVAISIVGLGIADGTPGKNSPPIGLSVVSLRAGSLRPRPLTSIALLTVLAAASPLAFQGFPVWQRRGQWQSFAGDISFNNTLTTLPILAILGPVLVAWGIRRLGSTHEEHTHAPVSTLSTSWIWWIAFLGPFLSAWLVTALGIAPMFHQRYVLCSALPLALLGAYSLASIRSLRLQFAAIGAVAMLLVLSQGTFRAWNHGQFIGWQRGEDWRGASAWIQAHWKPGNSLWCASGLIEGEDLQPPLPKSLDEYLSFPLRGIYSVTTPQGEFVEPQSLVSDASYWPQQWGSPGAQQNLFLVCRASPQELLQVLSVLSEQLLASGLLLQLEEPIEPFGNVTVALVRWSRAG